MPRLRNIVAVLALAAALSRLAPHFPNATAISALGLSSSAYLGKRTGIALTLGVMLATDFLIGFYDWRVMASVYASFAFTAFLGSLISGKRSASAVAAVTFFSSAFFFLATNAAVWAFSPWYEKTLAGFLYCLTMGIPFWRNMLLGDLIFVPLFFAVFELSRNPRIMRSLASYFKTLHIAGS